MYADAARAAYIAALMELQVVDLATRAVAQVRPL